MKILISETTREEREQIIEDSLGDMTGGCDGCMPGIVEMYQPYIDGIKELSEINREFTEQRAHYEKSDGACLAAAQNACVFNG